MLIYWYIFEMQTISVYIFKIFSHIYKLLVQLYVYLYDVLINV